MHGKVTVTGSVSQRKALRAARRTGKLAVLWPSAYNNPSYHQAHAMRAYYQYQYQANKPAQAQQHQYYSSVQRAGKNSGGISAVATKPAGHQYPQSKASSYNYHVHGYYDGKKFVAARLQTRLFAAPHKKVDRPHLQVHQITF
jgi:hypothetical protein